jgi:hypothetical protein
MRDHMLKCSLYEVVETWGQRWVGLCRDMLGAESSLQDRASGRILSISHLIPATVL